MENESIKEKYISSMTPEEILLGLLDKALLQLKRALRFAERENYEQANRALIAAQNIFLELQSMQRGEDAASRQAWQFWDVLAEQLFFANVNADRQRVLEIMHLVRRLRAYYLHHLGRI